MSYTKGPWSFHIENGLVQIFSERHTSDGKLLSLPDMVAVYSTVGNADNVANARLISSSPDLLLAAKEAAVVLAEIAKINGIDIDAPIEKDSRHITVVHRLIATINKAEGRQ